ncbi:hypothetical protein ACFPK9_08475 [Rubritalea spongiae]|uniref:Uncharacterized protein n=1 Tax=Rubritalea spongiae TaxID=430797 RepID=A0ABW5E3L3_9BACT
MAKIPERKRSSDELARMQMQNAMQMRPPVAQYQRQVAHPVLLVLGYLLSLGGAGLLIGPILYFAKPLSRHHACFLFLISLIVLGAGALYYYENYARYTY